MKIFVITLASLMCYVTAVTPQVITNVYVGGGQTASAAFSVQYGKAITSDAVKHTPIPFDVIRRNDQDVYNKATGEFTAPTKGVYMLYFSASAHNGYMAVYLHSSVGNYLASASAGAANVQASNMVIIELDAGTKISVRLNPKHAARSCSPPCSTFSGYLLYATS